MEVTFWGVRGSFPVPGPRTVRYGGHTSCIEVQGAGGACVILDAGTGLRGLGQKLGRETNRRDTFHLLLSHVHWDHIQGLPFFEPAYIPGVDISIYAQRSARDELKQVIGGITRHEFYPVSLESAPAEFHFHEVGSERTFSIDSFQVSPVALNHPFGALGYVLEENGNKVAYVSDTAPFCDMLHKQHFVDALETPTAEDLRILSDMEQRLVASLDGVDTVVYDTHFTPEEYASYPHYGHSTPEHALEICAKAKVRRLVLFHHAPSHDDETMDKIEARYREKGQGLGVEVIAAKESSTLRIPETGASR